MLVKHFEQDDIDSQNAQGFAGGPIGDMFARDVTNGCREERDPDASISRVSFRIYNQNRCLYTDRCTNPQYRS